MKKLLLLPIILFAFTSSFAIGVDVTKAMDVAKSFYANRATTAPNVNKQNISLSLVYTLSYSGTNNSLKQANENLYYIFNVNTNDGFVIITGDDIVLPILGYSNRGNYSITDNNPAFRKWMEGYKEQIEFAIENNLSATPEITTKWDELINPENYTNQAKSINAVNPLVSTTWNQLPYYNASCPADASLPDASNSTSHCVTGCPATAMAQILKYWNYPAMGAGFHSYNHATYGTLSANFGNTTYNWASMPNNVTSANAAVATLMYHCGVAVDMNYSPDLSGGYVIINSPTPTANCEYAYKTYFGYDPSTLQGLERTNYSDVAWKALLQTELDNGRPVQYAGFGTGGGHTFVCDGYDANGNFDMNWGWGGMDDGFFNLDALNPGTLGTGGGAGGYNSNQQAVIGIKPLQVSGTANLDLNSVITVTPNPINFYTAFTVNADIINAGTTNFNGDYCAALFSSTGTFIDYIQIDTTGANPLAPGYHYTGGITFSNTGILTVPGNYIIGIYYKQAGGNWLLAGNTTYANPINITIAGPVNAMNLYSAITPSPTTFVNGQTASVNFNIINSGTTTYKGGYLAALYDLSGNWVETIGTYSETVGLPAGYTYSSPFITLSTSAVTAAPGTYILAISVYDSTASTYYLAGTTYFTNPLDIKVIAPNLTPDIYEVNNTEATAHIFPLTFVNNNAHIITTGSNIHISSDIDFYKIFLGTGYNYTITARANDSQSSADGNTYTDDVLWSYDTGSGFVTTYDDLMAGNIYISGSGSVTFKVASYFLGNVGTYVMDIKVTRVSTLGINEIGDDTKIEIYPNPFNTQSTIRFSEEQNNTTVKLIDVLGKEIKTINFTGKELLLEKGEMHAGIYFVQIIDENKNITNKKIIIQ